MQMKKPNLVKSCGIYNPVTISHVSAFQPISRRLFPADYEPLFGRANPVPGRRRGPDMFFQIQKVPIGAPLGML
jgi:hypothetical protein